VSLFLFRRPVKHRFSFFYTAEIIVQKILIFICPSSTHYPKIFSYVGKIMGEAFSSLCTPPQVTPMPSMKTFLVVTLLVWSKFTDFRRNVCRLLQVRRLKRGSLMGLNSFIQAKFMCNNLTSHQRRRQSSCSPNFGFIHLM
jgi:hypothetical protein